MSTELLPSAQRPVPMRMRGDLHTEFIDFQLSGSWVIKDPVTLKYHRLQPEQYAILQLLDGQRNLEELRDEYRREYPTTPLTLEELQSIISELHRSGMVVSERYNQGIPLLVRYRENWWKKFWQGAQNILFLRLPGWDPETSLQILHPFVKWMFTPFGVALWFVVVLSSWVLLAIEFETFHSKLPAFQQFFGWPNLLYMWAMLGVAKVIHEFGHGLSCKHFGGECHEMGAMLLVFSPCLYCDVTDSWLMKNKWHRIMIGAAGMYIEVFLAAFAIFGWWLSEPGLFHYLCLNLFFISTVTTVMFNLNPLMRYDGYYMLSDFLEIPNLRPKADKLLQEKFAWYCLGIEPRPDPFMPQRGHIWFVLFAIAAAIYKWMVAFTILFFFYTFLKPYGLQSIGVVLAVFSAGMIVWGLGRNIYMIVSAPRRDPVSKVRIAISLVLLAAALTAAALVPFPWSIEAALVIEPHNVQHVYTVTPGLLSEVRVQPGDTVQAGDVLAVLTNQEKELEREKLRKDLAIQETEIATQDALRDFARRQLAVEKRATLVKQLADINQQIENLTIRAPIGGKVIAPPRVEAPRHNDQATQLPTWHGTPFDERNRESFLDTRTHLISLAPDDRFQAVLLVDQGDRNDISVGTEIRLKLDHLANDTYYGTVDQLSERPVDYAPRALSNKSGGDLATVTDAQGREKLESIAYQATVVLDQDVPLLRSGQKGRAKFIVARRSVKDWVWRYLRRTFHFRL